MVASFVLASLRGSTYGAEYDSPLRSLRPCWTAFLNIQRDMPVPFEATCRGVSLERSKGFSTTF